MSSFKSHFTLNKQERSGIFFLLFFLIIVQLGYYLYQTNVAGQSSPFAPDNVVQAEIDSLRTISLKKDTVHVYPFNPNFITDFKGYTLGMSVEEIDRLHEFRTKDEFVNTTLEFQNVTKVSDSLLKIIAPFFKFPEWTQNKKRKTYNTSTSNYKVKNVIWKDLNTATAEDLKKISGIGEKLSARIIKFRDRLGGFLIDDQLFDVYGLEVDVVARALKQFKVITKPNIIKINVNTATAEELAKLIYLQKHVAESIVNYRNLNGSINSLNDLVKIEEFPAERINRIALYLSL
ncbi:DNA uptake protein ComE-like DNA-binding protein [Maribacter caenipelagi]|uniref:DNA uptake protein ComE-like DNA-binding protein n=1 Tax=Maribacter caenipelagi TaxID=1447781 RepID=A0A4R7CU51_9FLAO|nr:helix-hairpin-helix domain-containing protein [Maribacter caenipelagi]TDS11640.1 DNA uptake protein ComE-like DNA-binding protein [Maribacter caenipelagi]